MNAPISLAEQVKQVAMDGVHLQHSLAHRLNVLLCVAENLADCHRVLNDFSHHEGVTNGRDSAVFREACASWRVPHDEGGFELLRDLMMVARDLCSESAQRAERVFSRSFEISGALSEVSALVAPADSARSSNSSEGGQS